MAGTSAVPTGVYAPNAPVSDDPKVATHWAHNEFQKLSRTLQEMPWLRLKVLNRAPERPRTAMVAYADGTHWNPGAGEGLYLYKSDAAWHKIV
jgi:hypothetical protein